MSEFVFVKRVEHGDTDCIVKEVQEKYPHLYELIEAPVEVTQEVINPIKVVDEVVVEPIKKIVKKGK